MVNLSSFIHFHAQRTPDKTALTYRGERISYAQFLSRIESLGAWLSKQGVGPGDVVAVLMKNSSAFLEIAFATSHVGAVLLPVNYRLSQEEVTYIVGDAGARLLLVDDDLLSRAGGAERIVTINEAEIQAAMRHYFTDTHNVAEGAGAAAAQLGADRPCAARLRDLARPARPQ